jgi:hypothetical protein
VFEIVVVVGRGGVFGLKNKTAGEYGGSYG